MGRRFFELAFTPAVRAVQSRRGSRETYARVDDRRDAPADFELGPREIAFLGSRDSFYLASVFETGWPYIQHRGGPRGFVRGVDAGTIGWAEFRGNRQYITTGNVSSNDRVALLFMDYAARRRLKLRPDAGSGGGFPARTGAGPESGGWYGGSVGPGVCRGVRLELPTVHHAPLHCGRVRCDVALGASDKVNPLLQRLFVASVSRSC
jgi:Pyridoxamine 5'-phosphate oxidase